MEEQSTVKTIPTRIAGLQIIRHAENRRVQPSVKPGKRLAAAWRRRRLALEPLELSSPTFVDSMRGEQAICCLAGELFVVAVDVRVDSQSYGQWQSFYLPADPTKTLAAPSGIALGWQATEPGCELALGQYQTARHASRSMAWDDPELDIIWPHSPASKPWQAAELVDLLAIEAAAACESFRFKPTRNAPLLKASESKLAQQLSIEPPLASLTADVIDLPRATRPIASSGKPTILVIGSSGQLGHDLCRHLRSAGRVIGACRKPERGVLPIPTFVDVSRPASIREAIRRTQPQIIVNASGLTDPVTAELDPRRAQCVNATAPAVMAEEAKKVGAAMIHFCTDKVFGGTGERPWRESDTPQPLNQYGLTKLRGTAAVRASGIPHLIFRTGWLYSTHGQNYVQSMVDLITYRSTLQLANDCYGTPTSTDWLSRLVAGLLQRGSSDPLGWIDQHSGLYNACLLGYASRLDVGDQVVATCRQHALPIVLDRLEGVSLDVLSKGVVTPKNCRLDASRLATQFQISLPSWREELNRQIATIVGVGDSSLLSIA